MYRVIRLVYNNTERESSLSGSMIQNDNDDKHTDPSDSFQSYRCAAVVVVVLLVVCSIQDQHLALGSVSMTAI